MTLPGKATIYADCFSGASGDMFLGALLDAGFPEKEFRRQISLLQIFLPEIQIKKVREQGLTATRVIVAEESHQPHRNWQEIRNIITESILSVQVQSPAVKIFQELARAEAKVHGCKEEEVHFHEVGGLDAIVDIVGTAAGLAHFGVRSICASPLPMPRGSILCSHGRLPVPAPAVCEILADVPVYGVAGDQEMVTPTGAAILKAMADTFGPMPSMILKQTGYGAGSRQGVDGLPNMLRLFIGQTTEADEAQTVQVIETNLDDWSPEGFPYLCELLFAHGALDVTLIPVHMKKGRPGFLLQVLSTEAAASKIKHCILSETSAIGLRFHKEQRLTLPRRIVTVTTPWGPVQAKQIKTPTGTVITPEYEDCRRIALENNIPLRTVYAKVADIQEKA